MPPGITLAPLRQRGLSPFNPFECLLQDPFGLRLAALLVPTAEQVSRIVSYIRGRKLKSRSQPLG
jgi:hypothetical protein